MRNVHILQRVNEGKTLERNVQGDERIKTSVAVPNFPEMRR